MSLQPVDVQRIFLSGIACSRLSRRRASYTPFVSRSDRRCEKMVSILPDCLRLHLLRGRILSRNGWLDFGRTDVISSGCACDAGLMVADAIQRRFFLGRLVRTITLRVCGRWMRPAVFILRGRSVADRRIHNPQAAGSSPASATNFGQAGFSAGECRGSKSELVCPVWRRPFFNPLFRNYLEVGGAQ